MKKRGREGTQNKWWKWKKSSKEKRGSKKVVCISKKRKGEADKIDKGQGRDNKEPSPT